MHEMKCREEAARRAPSAALVMAALEVHYRQYRQYYSLSLVMMVVPLKRSARFLASRAALAASCGPWNDP